MYYISYLLRIVTANTNRPTLSGLSDMAYVYKLENITDAIKTYTVSLQHAGN